MREECGEQFPSQQGNKATPAQIRREHGSCEEPEAALCQWSIMCLGTAQGEEGK